MAMAQHPEKDGPQQPTERWTMPIETCAICDKDRDPLQVPDEACGHDHEYQRTVMVEVVPALVAERLATAAQTYLVSIGRYGRPPGGPGLATDTSIAEAELRAALEAYSGDST